MSIRVASQTIKEISLFFSADEMVTTNYANYTNRSAYGREQKRTLISRIKRILWPMAECRILSVEC